MKQMRKKTLPGVLLQALGAGIALTVVAGSAYAQQQPKRSRESKSPVPTSSG
jgi:hypothetical protein